MSWEPIDDEPAHVDPRTKYRNSRSLCACDNCNAPATDNPDDAPTGEWIVFGETGKAIATYGQDEYAAKEAARMCGGRDRGIAAQYVEVRG